jgi:hypothetical protein
MSATTFLEAQAAAALRPSVRAPGSKAQPLRDTGSIRSPSRIWRRLVLPQILNWLFFKAVWTGDRPHGLPHHRAGRRSLPDGWKRRVLGLCRPLRAVHVRLLSARPAVARRSCRRPVMFVGLLIPFLMPKAPYKG